MNVNDLPGPKPTFNARTVAAVLKETGLPLAEGQTAYCLENNLEQIAREHYWQELSTGNPKRQRAGISFDALADASVTPSRLKMRLLQIEGSAKRVFAGTGNRPLKEKIQQLLSRLGRNQEGYPLKFSGTETIGHAGSERSAIWLCFVRAVNVYESPPLGYLSGLQDRPWASQRLEGAIQALVIFLLDPDRDRDEADRAARAIHCWAGWSIQLVHGLLASDRARHKGEIGLDITLRKLEPIYCRAFSKEPSLYIRSSGGVAPAPNEWVCFLQAVLKHILRPDELPSTTALKARWLHIKYTKPKKRT